eukprot:jgi/Astpho2/1758/Aster-04179
MLAQLGSFSGQAIHVGQGTGRAEVLISVQGDGVICYDGPGQNRLKSWALGSSELQFAVGAVGNAVTQRVYAVVRHASARRAASAAQELLVSWPAASTGGSIANFAATTGTALAQAVHALHAAEGPSTAAAPAAIDGTAAAQSAAARAAAHSTGDQAPQPSAKPQAEDSSAQQTWQAGVFVVLCDSSVSLDGSHTNGGTEPRPADCHAVASAVNGSTLAVVSSVGKARDTLVEVYQAQAHHMCRLGTEVVQPPQEGASVSSVALRGERLLLLWSTQHLQTFELRRGHPGGFLLHRVVTAQLPVQQSGVQATQHQPLGAASPPGELQNGRKPPKDKMHKSRKRKSCDAEDDPPGAAPAALVNGLVQGMATGAAASAAAVLPLTGSTAACLRLVQDFGTQLQVMTADTTYGCLLSQEGCPLPRLAQWQGACAPLHAVQLGSGAGDVAVLAAGEAFFASLQAEEVSLADLVSKLSVTAGDLTPKDRLPSALPQQPATPDSTQEEAFAEYSQTPWTVLEDAEAERPVQAAAQAAGRSLVAVPAAVRWHADMLTPEQHLQRQLEHALREGFRDSSAAAELAGRLASAMRSHGHRLPHSCLGSFLALLQERKWWQALSALLAGQPLLSLSLCPGLVCALAEAGQYALIPLVAAQAPHIEPAELAAALQRVLAGSNDTAQRDWHQALQRLATESRDALQSEAREGPGAAADLPMQDAAHGPAAAAASGPPAAAAAPEGAALQLQQRLLDQTAVVAEGFSPMEVCLHPLVSMPIPQTERVAAVRQLPAAAALQLLQYLAKLLPEPERVIAWVAAILDVHLTALVLQPNSQQRREHLQGRKLGIESHESTSWLRYTFCLATNL